MTAAKRSRTRSSVTDLQKRQGEAADLLAAGFASAEVTSQLAAKHQVSRRTAQRWVLEGHKALSLAGNGDSAWDCFELAQLRLLAMRLYRQSVDAGNFNAGVGALKELRELAKLSGYQFGPQLWDKALGSAMSSDLPVDWAE
jgi:hypothetical protein